VTAEDGATGTYTVAWVAETVGITARSECVGARAQLAVKVTNAGAEPISVDIESDVGERSADVKAGDSVERVLAARTAELAAGEVSVVIDGGRTLTAPYEAATCR
jgi:hypothetical protein